MPVVFSETKGAFIEKLNSNKLMRQVAQNPVYTALIIGFLVFLIMLFALRQISPELAVNCNDLSLSEGRWISPKTRAIFTGAIYSSAAVAALMLLHNHILTAEIARVRGGETASAIMTETGLDDKSPDFVPVNINVDFANAAEF